MSIAVVIEQGMLGGHPSVRLISRFNSLDRLEEDFPDRDLAIAVLVKTSGLPPADLGQGVGKLGLVGLLLSRGGRDHDPARGGQGRKKRPGGRRGDPEHLFPAGMPAEEFAALVVAKVRSRQVEVDMALAQIGMTQEEHPEPSFGGQLGPDLRHRAADRFEARRILPRLRGSRSRP